MSLKEKIILYLSRHNLLLYIIISTLYFEFVFHISCFKGITFINTVNIILFTLPICLLIYLLSTLFNKKINKIIVFIFIIFLTILFASQFIYYNLFKAIYGFSSINLVNQVLVVLDKVVDTIIINWYIILLLIIPLVFLIIFNKKLNYEIDKKNNTFWSLYFIIGFYIISLLSINIKKDDIYSNYNLYFKVNQPILLTNNLGLTTNVGVELYRTIASFNETITLKEQSTVLKDDKTYNITEIDFDKLNEKTTDENIITLNNFFKNRQPTEQNEYTGIYKNKNLIFILAESLDKSIISADLTPTLYKLKTEGMQFNNYYTPLFPGSTGAGEYMTEWGLIAAKTAKSDQLSYTIGNYNPYRLNNSLKNLGYKTFAYHDYTGDFYDREKYFQNDNYDNIGFCQSGTVSTCDNFRGSDLEMIQNTIDTYINEDKFFTYYVTVSGHGNYNYNDNSIAQKNYEEVSNLEYSDQLKTYIAANKELDKALEYLINSLEKAGKLDDTVIVITPDHYPYYFENNELNEIDTEDRSNKFLVHHQNLIIWDAQKRDVQNDKFISNIDILPTLLNLFGIEFDSRLLIGTDAFSKEGGIVALADYSWVNEKGTYDATSKKFVGNGLSKLDISSINAKINTYFNISNLIQEKKYYTYLFDNIKK